MIFMIFHVILVISGDLAPLKIDKRLLSILACPGGLGGFWAIVSYFW